MCKVEVKKTTREVIKTEEVVTGITLDLTLAEAAFVCAVIGRTSTFNTPVNPCLIYESLKEELRTADAFYTNEGFDGSTLQCKNTFRDFLKKLQN